MARCVECLLELSLRVAHSLLCCMLGLSGARLKFCVPMRGLQYVYLMRLVAREQRHPHGLGYVAALVFLTSAKGLVVAAGQRCARCGAI